MTQQAWWLKPGEAPDFKTIPQFLTPSGSDGITYPWSDMNAQWFDQPKRKILLEPDFQRGHVWTEDKQIAYVEYCLQGGLGARTIYWNHPESAHRFNEDECDLDPTEYVLVDGLQRITAVQRWLRDEIPAFGFVRSKWQGREREFNCRFLFVYNSLPTRAQVLQWYLQLNGGGVVHSPEELARVRALLDAEKGAKA